MTPEPRAQVAAPLQRKVSFEYIARKRKQTSRQVSSARQVQAAETAVQVTSTCPNGLAWSASQGQSALPTPTTRCLQTSRSSIHWMLPNKLRTNAGDASACCSSASMSADVKIAHSLDVAKRVAHERRRRVSVLLLSIGLLGWFSSLLYLMLDIYAKLPRNAPSAFFVLTALPPSVALCVLAILPSDRRLTYLAMSLSRFMCALFGVFFAAAGPLFAAEHISWSELSPNAAATFCTGYSLTCIGTAAALAHLLRPQASAPSTCSRAWFALSCAEFR